MPGLADPVQTSQLGMGSCSVAIGMKERRNADTALLPSLSSAPAQNLAQQSIALSKRLKSSCPPVWRLAARSQCSPFADTRGLTVPSGLIITDAREAALSPRQPAPRTLRYLALGASALLAYLAWTRGLSFHIFREAEAFAGLSSASRDEGSLCEGDCLCCLPRTFRFSPESPVS